MQENKLEFYEHWIFFILHIKDNKNKMYIISEKIFEDFII